MKYCVIILDGAAGWPLDGLGGLTTLQSAHTPNLDAMAEEGLVGMVATVPPGTEPSSSAACMSILGYDPVADYVGRGAIEAASMGIALADADVALRMNLVTIDDGAMRSYACGHITTAESTEIVKELASELTDDVFSFHAGVAYRHILVAKGHTGLVDATFTPPHDISGQLVEGRMPKGPDAEVLLDLMGRAHSVLERSAVNVRRVARGDLPATDIWPFWPGLKPRGLKTFREKTGMSAAMSSGVDLLGGLAVLSGMDRLAIEGVSDGPDNDYAAQAEGCLDALGDHDLVVIHVESPDEAGHAGDVEAKIDAIEAIDREVVSRVMDIASRVPMRVLAMPDHPTPIELKTHVGESVPFVLWGESVERRGAVGYHEAVAAESGILVDPGYGILELLLG